MVSYSELLDEIIEFIAELPRNATGKILKRVFLPVVVAMIVPMPSACPWGQSSPGSCAIPSACSGI